MRTEESQVDEAYTFGPEDEAAANQTTTPESTEAPAPRLAQITEDQFQDLLRKTTAIDEVKAEHKRLLDAAFGKLGGMQQVVDQLKSQLHAGGGYSDDDFDELRKEYGPELAAAIVKGINKRPNQAPAFDQAKFDQQVNERFQEAHVRTKDEAKNEIAAEILEETHPDWRKIVGPPPSQQNGFAKNDFRQWLDRQPDAYRQKLNSSNNPNLIAKAIDAYSKSKAPAPKPENPSVSARQKRIEAAVNPRGAGGHATGTNSAEDEMASGYSSG